jgi:hypothetical protein
VSLHFGFVAMNEENESLHTSQTWDLVKLSEGTKTVRLRRSLYCLEQSLGLWYNHFVYCGQFSYGSFVYLLRYVNDMFIAAKSMFEVKRLKFILGEEFEMMDLGSANKILGLGLLSRTTLILVSCVIVLFSILIFYALLGSLKLVLSQQHSFPLLTARTQQSLDNFLAQYLARGR